jgi:imidazole glycerol-phosphate synthase subunit HisF
LLTPRIIPALLIQNGGLVKTVSFVEPKYLGDPINTVRIFNEKEVDELIVIDIDATTQNREPNYSLISNIASECRMPLCYAGGVKTTEQIERIICLGVEKVAISSAAIETPRLISESANRIGSQSIVVVMDVKKSDLFSGYELFTHNGNRATGISPKEFAKDVEDMGAGEVLLNSIDNDGKMKGYDFVLIDQVYDLINIPMTALGGCGSLTNIEELVERFGVIGAAAGSLFVFKGKYRSVLMNYPDILQKKIIFGKTPEIS